MISYAHAIQALLIVAGPQGLSEHQLYSLVAGFHEIKEDLAQLVKDNKIKKEWRQRQPDANGNIYGDNWYSR